MKWRKDILLYFIVTYFAIILYQVVELSKDQWTWRILVTDVIVFTGLFLESVAIKENEISNKTDNGVISSMLLCLYLVVFLPYSNQKAEFMLFNETHASNLYIAGIALTLTGISLRYTARKTLANLFSYTLSIQKDHQLITHGIYSYLRHPAYLGTYVFMIGYTLLHGSYMGFIFMLVMIPSAIIRIRREEKMLIKEFGNQYIEYKKHVKLLIPFIF